MTTNGRDVLIDLSLCSIAVSLEILPSEYADQIKNKKGLLSPPSPMKKTILCKGFFLGEYRIASSLSKIFVIMLSHGCFAHAHRLLEIEQKGRYPDSAMS